MSQLKPRLVASKICEGVQTVLEDFKEKIIADEINMTDRLASAIRVTLDGKNIAGVKWRARTLRAYSGIAAEEREFGADLLGVLEIDLPERRTKKGFLAQAKVAEPGKLMGQEDWRRFQKQCKTMLENTPDSFGLIYSRSRGVVILPVQTVLEIDRKDLFTVGSRTLHGFFEDYIKCEIGDRRLRAPTIDALRRYSTTQIPDYETYNAKFVLGLKVTNAKSS